MVGDVRAGTETLTIAERRAQDIARMLGGANGDALAEVRGGVAPHMPDAAGDVESMIPLGRLDIQS